ncbi:transposase [Ralstonia solanacearum]|nr:transposase [Ralstonia solanacearum]
MNTLINLETGFPANPWLAWGGKARQCRAHSISRISAIRFVEYFLAAIFQFSHSILFCLSSGVTAVCLLRRFLLHR